MSENKKYLILIVEDDLGMQNQHKIALEKAGYLVETASGYQEAIDKIRNRNIDLAIIDIELDKNDPENADGLRVVAQINKIENKPQVVLATGLISRVTTAWKESVFGVWEKNEPRDALLQKIKISLETRDELTPAKIKNSLTTIIGRMARERLHLEQVLDLIMNEMVILIKAESANLSIVDNNKIKVKATTGGVEGINKEFDIENSVSGLAVRRQKTVYFPDIENDDLAKTLFKPALGEDKLKGSEFAVPIMIDLEPIAVINFESPQKNAFKETNIKLIEELAGQVAIAINSARLQNQTNTVKLLSEISSEINIIINKGESVVAKNAVEKMIEFMKCDKAAIFNYDVDHTKIDFIAQKGLKEEYIMNSTLLEEDSPRALVARTRQPLIVSDINNDERFVSVRELAQKEEFTAILELPLQVGEKMVGSIAAYYKDIHNFEPEEIALDELFADHIAIALNNAQQYQMLQELKEREKKEAEERLAAEIVHRMKNSVGAIRVWVMNANRDCDSIIKQNPDLMEAFHHIGENADEALELVRELKNKQGILQSQIVDIAEHIRIAVDSMNVGHHIYKFLADINIEKILVLADEHLHRVFINLIENAIDAMPNGGTISIGMKKIDNFVEAWVSDTGRGIPQKQLDQIFRFWYTDKDAEGRGTGLWWVRKYLEAFGGGIVAESKGANQGAKLTIKLPLASGKNKKTVLESILES